MKRTIITLAYLALALTAGCTREILEDSSPEARSILAIIDNDSPGTRTITVDNPGVRVNTYWKDGDRIGVIGKSGSPAEFSVAAGDISADGKSASFRSQNAVPGGSLLAFSPWQEGVSASGNKLILNFPATQKHTLYSGVSQPDPGSNKTNRGFCIKQK